MARSNRLRPVTAASERGSKADRSSYFARREAAKVLKSVLQGDASRKAVASIKSLVYSPSVRNKKATFALVCQTLKYLPLLKDVLSTADILNGKWKKQEELMYIITYDILFGQAIVLLGAAEKFLFLRKSSIESALARLCVRQKVNVEDLLLQYTQTPVVSRPRYVRVNTLKINSELASQELGKVYKVTLDEMVPDLLVLPSGTDLHDHPLVKNGSVILQGKASCMVAVALAPEPGWEVLDACSAPGNKTVHLAALMRGNGKVNACELNKDRVRHLEDTVKRSGASNVEVLHCNFLDIDVKDLRFKKVRAILLDPSCSGSGTVAERLDYLLPSYTPGHSTDASDMQRVKKLAAFQRRALAHALTFPSVERVVYSTCSIYQTENEDVIKSVLPLATSLNFQLATPFPQWPRRGLPVFEGSEHLLRTDSADNMEGFFIALFVRNSAINEPEKLVWRKDDSSKPFCQEKPCDGDGSKDLQSQSSKFHSLHVGKRISQRRITMAPPFHKMHLLLLHHFIVGRRNLNNGRARMKNER